jgi:hypothetical protein
MSQPAVLRGIGCGIFLVAACSGGTRSDTAAARNGGSPEGAASVADSRVDVAARAACQVGDTLLRRVPGTVFRRSPAVAFDSLWHGATNRWACRLAAVGHAPNTYAPIDSLLAWLKARGWLEVTTMSADGPDGTLQGIRQGGVTCLVEGRWDGGDDADTTYVPSDTMEVHFACTRTAEVDTLAPS